MDGVNPAASGAQASNRDAIADEFEVHVQQCAEQLQREGLTPAHARAEAERRFGDATRHHEQCRREAPEERMNAKARLMLRLAVLAQGVAIAVLVTLVWRQDLSIADFRREVDVLKAQSRVQAIDSPSAQAVQRGARQSYEGPDAVWLPYNLPKQARAPQTPPWRRPAGVGPRSAPLRLTPPCVRCCPR